MTTEPDAIRMRYVLDEQGTLEMMTRGGKAILGRKQMWRLNGFFLVMTALAMAGGGVATNALIDAVVAVPQVWQRAWLPLGGALTAGGLMLVWQSMNYVTLARASVTSRFSNGTQVMTATPRGITLENATGLWETRWEGIEAVVTGKTGIGFVVSGIVLPVPRTAVSEPDVDRITRWCEAAR